MQYLSLIGTVAVLNMLAAISPGPDFVMVVKNSLKYSRRSGIFTGLGIGTGLSVHILYCAAGIGYIISKSILVFSVIKYLGAAYLVYIGIMSFFSKESKIETHEEHAFVDLTKWQAFKMGFITNILNPKATLFFLSLFTLVINHPVPVSIIVIVALISISEAIAWFTFVSVFFTQEKVQRLYLKSEKYVNKFLGGLLFGLGIKVALMK
jgi:RhtB (resistance to homoserine/threonine) family protein